jgi:hypothetical protein
MSILDSDDPYRHVEIRGRVASSDDDPAYRFIDSLAVKYLDQDRYPYTRPGDQRVVISVPPEHVNIAG